MVYEQKDLEYIAWRAVFNELLSAPYAIKEMYGELSDKDLSYIDKLISEYIEGHAQKMPALSELSMTTNYLHHKD